MPQSAWTPVDEKASAWKPVAESPAAAPQGFLGSFSDASGLTGIGNAISHPIDTIMGIPSAIAGEAKRSAGELKTAWNTPRELSGKNITSAIDHTLYAIPVVGGSLKMADEQAAAGNYAGAAGTASGMVAGLAAPKILKEGIPVAAQAVGGTMANVGKAATESGLDRISKTVGALQKDFDKGHNLGRGYMEAGMGTSSSMRSIAVKASDALDDVGNKIGNAYSQAQGVNIPVNDVIDSLAKPLRAAHDMESGFGGSGSTTVLEDYAKRLKPELSKAYARGGFTPSELFDLKQKLTKNINWKSTSDIESKLNNVREAQYGGLTDLLNDAVPEVKPLNQAYGDLKTLQKRASLRADTQSSPLTNFKEKGIITSAGVGIGAMMGGPTGAVVGGAAGLAADSMPFKTATASGLFRGGTALSAASSSVGAITTPAILPSVAAGAYALVDKGENKYSDNNSNVDQISPPALNQEGNTAVATTLKGSSKWADLGAAKLSDHISRSGASDINAADIEALSKTPQGKQLLVNASDLNPGSAAMKNLVKQIKQFNQPK
jgi:hypothetical protein